jgi:hypothetical protein
MFGRTIIDRWYDYIHYWMEEGPTCPPAFDLLVVYQGSIAYLRTDRLLVDGEMTLKTNRTCIEHTQFKVWSSDRCIFLVELCHVCAR